jgi:ATP-dependent helicase/nuclease subunit A
MDAAVELIARDHANADQRAASDPAVSAWVSASAGSGKTKLLTDRLLRLMLGGADPARIQCLTYTKAAAAEMALRLRGELGRWVTLPDAELDQALHALAVPSDAEKRRLARGLFATVLDLPGGMRIGTIHAFCQSLLRRFPLEARISPHFRLIEDAQADAARRDATETVLGPTAPEQLQPLPAVLSEGQRHQALAHVAGLANLAQFDQLVCSLIAERDRLAGLLARPMASLEAQQRAALCAERDAGAILRDAVDWPEQAAVRDALRIIADQGTPKRSAPKAQVGLDWFCASPDERCARWAEYQDSFIKDDGDGYSWKTFVGETLGKRDPALRDVMEREQARVLAIREALRAARLAETSAALLHLGLPIARTYAAGKQAAIRLDYADLIERTTALLRDPGVAWVLYKLDGGLDHLLLDEAQDTAPAQWRIAEQLVGEFFAGAGARETKPRTVFAVGDRKQSIFSFQGADPAAFTVWREKLRQRVEGSAGRWRDVSLTVSFRSTTPVLALVDAVFGGPRPPPGVVEDETLTHRSDREGQAGFVELWPLVSPPPAEEPPPWQVPMRQEQPKSAPQRLAEELAEWIALATGGDTILASRARPLRPGDILVLLRTRTSPFARALVRCLKQRGVPVAGLDRMVLTEQPAVADLLALCDTLLLPEDDLSLACVLTSPLGFLSDDSLMALAAQRAGSLWQELHDRAHERPDWTRAKEFCRAARADDRGAGRARRPCPPAVPVRPRGGGADRRIFGRRPCLCAGRTAVAAGFRALAAPFRCRGEARGTGTRWHGPDHDSARCQRAAGAGGDSARHDRAAERGRPAAVGRLAGRRSAGVVPARGAALRQRQNVTRCGFGAPRRGIPPAALRGADTGRGWRDRCRL